MRIVFRRYGNPSPVLTRPLVRNARALDDPADHNGFIRVRDNVPRGSRFVMEFPVRRRAAELAVRAQHGAYARA